MLYSSLEATATDRLSQPWARSWQGEATAGDTDRPLDATSTLQRPVAKTHPAHFISGAQLSFSNPTTYWTRAVAAALLVRYRDGATEVFSFAIA